MGASVGGSGTARVVEPRGDGGGDVVVDGAVEIVGDETDVGVARTLGSVRKGWPSGRGSVSQTSRAAPAMDRDVSAPISAGSSTMGPREVLISQEVGFMAASSSAPTSPRVRSLRTR